MAKLTDLCDITGMDHAGIGIQHYVTGNGIPALKYHNLYQRGISRCIQTWIFRDILQRGISRRICALICWRYCLLEWMAAVINIAVDRVICFDGALLNQRSYVMITAKDY